MAIKTPPYFKWRDGRPRWEPGPGVRALKFQGRDLKDDNGRWLGLEGAITAAEALNDEVKACRDGAPRRAPATPISHERTCRLLAERYYASADFQLLAESTQADYRRKIGLFLGTEFGTASVRAVTKPQALGFWQQSYDKRGHAMANGIKASVSAMFSYAELIGWRNEESNPFLKLRRPKLPPRIAIWTPDKAQAMVTISDTIALPEVGDAIVIGLHTSQRLGDVLDMPLRTFASDRVALTQMKRKALIDAPMTSQLKARMTKVRERYAARSVIDLDAKAIVDLSGKAYDRYAFNKAYRAVRDETVAQHPEFEVDLRFAPRLSELTFQDTRDTAVTRLALAGCTLPQIAAITGHKPAHITSVIQHYLALDVAMADEAIARLSIWLDTNRIAI